MKLNNGKIYKISSGQRQVQVLADATNPAKMKISQDGLAPFDAISADKKEFYTEYLSACEITVELTGTAQISISPDAGIVVIDL